MATDRPDIAQETERVGSTVQSVDRALALLKAVAASPGRLTARELALVGGINRTTAYRLLGTLERHGLIDRDPETQRYAIGYGAAQIAGASSHDALARRARPILRRLAERCAETVSLAVPQRFELVYIDQVEPAQRPVSPSWTGKDAVMHATATGKAFLAWLPAPERAALLPDSLQRFTPTTITDPAELERQLANIRRDGIALAVGELEEFTHALAAAVLDSRSRPVAIINVWGPKQRLPRQRLQALGAHVLGATHELAAQLA